MDFKYTRKMKTIVLITALFFCGLCDAQQTPTIYINGSAVSLQGDVSFPYWVSASSTIALGVNAVSASVLEFNIANNELVFSQVIHLTTTGTVPAGAVWKIEAIGIGYNSAHPNTSEFSTDVSPAIFQSPRTFTTTTTWTVPNDVTNICIEAWGQGGRGGYASTTKNGGGGGGGAYAYNCVDVTPGAILNITINADSTYVGSFISASAGENGQNGTSVAAGANGLGGVNTNTYLYSINGADGIGTSGGAGGNGGSGGVTVGYTTTVAEFPAGGGMGITAGFNGINTYVVAGGGQVIIYF